MDFILILIILIIIAFIYYYFLKYDNNLDFIKPIINLSEKSINQSVFDDNENKEINDYLNSIYIEETPVNYINSKFLRNVNHANIYYDETTNHEYKIYPLCCISCKINAIKEIRYLKDLPSDKYSVPITFNKPFTTKIFPNKNINNAKLYLVIEREHLSLIDNSITNINYESFTNLINTIYYIQNKYNKYVSDLTINNIGVDSKGNIKIIDLNCIDTIIFGINIYSPKYSILNKLNPDLFGKNKEEYINFSKLIIKKT